MTESSNLYKMLSTFINNAFEFLITWVGTFRVGIRLAISGVGQEPPTIRQFLFCSAVFTSALSEKYRQYLGRT